VSYGAAVDMRIAWVLSDNVHGNCVVSMDVGPLKSGELHAIAPIVHTHHVSRATGEYTGVALHDAGL
jgi:hypothetical protein